MAIKNKYIYRSRISEPKFREIIRLFAMDIEATKIAALSGVSRNSINKILLATRKRLSTFCESESPFDGEIEIDESYFGGKRIKGLRGRGAYKKVPVIGLRKRGGKVFTEIIPDCSRASLQAVIKGRIEPESIVHTDGWRGYHGLIDLGFKKHYRVDHGNNEFAAGKRHINGIESFWSYAKMRMVKFRGFNRDHFYLHLKETEFRFNYRNENLYQLILKIIRKQPLKLS